MSQNERGALVRLLIADDHALLREALVDFLVRDTEAEVDAVATLDALLARLEEVVETPYELILLDYDIPGANGLDGFRRVISLTSIPVALMSGIASVKIAEEALEAGAAGFIPKTLGLKSMTNAIAFMCAGEQFAPVKWMRESHEASTATASEADLTERERQVLAGLAEGQSNKELARDLGLQEVTIKLHVKTLSRKLGAKNRTHAAMIGRERKLI